MSAEETMPITSRHTRHAALVVLLAMAAACGTGEDAATPSAVGATGWQEFAGSWNAAGSRRVLHLEGDREASLLELKGTLLLSGPTRPSLGFRGDGLFLTDTVTGVTGRAAWTDERGEQVFSELTSGSEDRFAIHGTFVGGTGRYAGASGEYDFHWDDVITTAEGAAQGRTTNLRGRIHLAGAAP